MLGKKNSRKEDLAGDYKQIGVDFNLLPRPIIEWAVNPKDSPSSFFSYFLVLIKTSSVIFFSFALIFF